VKWVGQSYEKQGLVWKSLSEMNGDLLVLESLSNDGMLLDRMCHFQLKMSLELFKIEGYENNWACG